MSHFRPCDRDTPYLLPPSLDDWLPKDHLARFVADIVDQLNLSALIGRYRGAGSAAYHPAMLLALLIYGYATALFILYLPKALHPCNPGSSRRIEQATYDSLAFRYLAANTHPDDAMEHPSDGSAEGLKTRLGSIRSSSFHCLSSIHDRPTHDGRVQHLRLRFTVHNLSPTGC